MADSLLCEMDNGADAALNNDGGLTRSGIGRIGVMDMSVGEKVSTRSPCADGSWERVEWAEYSNCGEKTRHRTAVGSILASQIRPSRSRLCSDVVFDDETAGCGRVPNTSSGYAKAGGKEDVRHALKSWCLSN